MLLDRILAAAPDIDHALELASAAGWRVLRIDGPAEGGAWWVMLQGPVVDRLDLRHAYAPRPIRAHAYSNAKFRSLYGAVLIALLRGVHEAKAAPIEAEAVLKRMKAAA